jgi:PRTRC system protein E
MFFTQINQMMNQGVDITLVIRKKEGQLMVSTMPKSNGLKDEAQNHIVPLTITGTPEELDMGFFSAISQPIQKAAGLLTNMSRFEQQADKAAANSKAAKELKDKEAKEAKEKKEKFDKLLKAATELEAEKKYPEALASLQQARTFATAQAVKQVDEKIKALKIKTGQGSLFDMEPAAQTQQVQQGQQPAQGNTVQQGGQPQAVIVQPEQQPVNGSTGQNGQQPTQQPVYGNGQPMYQPAQGQPMYQQPVYQQPHGQPQNYNNPPYTVQAATEVIIEEPPLQNNGGYAVHREEEYAQYPDFPGYPNNNSPMFNHQNV